MGGVDGWGDDTITVLELSSFQLELIETFRPNIGVFLNLTADHLDRHRTMGAYGAAKARLFENQTEEDSAVMNADDSATTPYAPSRPQVYWFTPNQPLPQAPNLPAGELTFRPTPR